MFNNFHIEDKGVISDTGYYVIGIDKHGYRHGALGFLSYNKIDTEFKFTNIHGDDVKHFNNIGYIPRLPYTICINQVFFNWFYIHTNHRGNLPDYENAKLYFGSKFEPKLQNGVLITDGEPRSIYFIKKHLVKMFNQITNNKHKTNNY